VDEGEQEQTHKFDGVFLLGGSHDFIRSGQGLYRGRRGFTSSPKIKWSLALSKKRQLARCKKRGCVDRSAGDRAWGKKEMFAWNSLGPGQPPGRLRLVVKPVSEPSLHKPAA